VAWLRSIGCEWTSSAATAAAAGGHLKLLQHMMSQLPPCPINAGACAEAAAARGHLPVLELLLQQRKCSYFDIGVCAEAAARAGHLNILKWLAEQRPVAVADTGVCAEAAAAGEGRGCSVQTAQAVQGYWRTTPAVQGTCWLRVTLHEFEPKLKPGAPKHEVLVSQCLQD
jgi:hypothetical protein